MSEQILASNIKYLRTNYSKLSGAALSKKLGYSHSALGHWETNHITPNTNDLVKLSKYFGISIDDLCRFDFKLFEKSKITKHPSI